MALRHLRVITRVFKKSMVFCLEASWDCMIDFLQLHCIILDGHFLPLEVGGRLDTCLEHYSWRFKPDHLFTNGRSHPSIFPQHLQCSTTSCFPIPRLSSLK